MEPEEFLRTLKEPVRVHTDSDGFILPDPLTCPKCGETLQVSSWPWCPHESGTNSVVDDTIIGGLVMEHVYVGRRVDSKKELKDLLAAKGWRLSDSKTEATHEKFLKERGEYARDTQKERDRERLGQ